MKKILVALLLLLAVPSFAQSLNDYQYVVVPLRFAVQDSENQYRLNTILKKYLTDAGFNAVYENQQTDEIANNRCGNLYADVVKVKSVFSVKSVIVFKDCKNTVVYTSPEGSSKEKDYQKGYMESLAKAADILPKLNYKYNGKSAVADMPSRSTTSASVRTPASVNTVATAQADGTVYSVEAVATGYLIINNQTSNIALRLMKTSNTKVFIATNASGQGVLINENGEWLFQYYKDGKLYSEVFKVNI